MLIRQAAGVIVEVHEHVGRVSFGACWRESREVGPQWAMRAFLKWRRTLERLRNIRYRKPYCARHSSVSRNLMIGRSALWVAKQHGHSIATMLRVYAAWTEGAIEADLDAIERAMAAAPGNRRVVPTLAFAPTNPRTASSSSRSVARRKRDRLPERDLALDLSLADMCRQLSARTGRSLMAEREGFEDFRPQVGSASYGFGKRSAPQ